MQVIVFACQKGAAGKTTLVGHVAVQAELAGAGPIVVLDTDQQGAVAEWWNQRTDERPAFAQTFIEQIDADIAKLGEMGFGAAMVDTSSALSTAVEQVVQVADLVVIPCRPSPHDLRAVVGTIEMVRELGKPFVFVLNGAEPGEQMSEDAAAALAEYGTLSPVRIHNHVDFADSMFDGGTAMEANPEGAPAKEIAALWTYISGQLKATHLDSPPADLRSSA